MELCNLSLECYIESKQKEILLPSSSNCSTPRMRIMQIWDIMEDVTNGIAFIHAEKEIHRDLKPRNSKLSHSRVCLWVFSSLLTWGSKLEDCGFWSHY